MRRRLLPIALAVGILTAAGPNAQGAVAWRAPDAAAPEVGAPTAGTSGNNPTEIGGRQRDLAELTEREREVLAELLRLEQELAATRAAVAAAVEEAERLRERLAALREQVEALRREQQDLQRRLGRRLRHYYEHGNAGYLEALLGAESLSDFLWRMDILARLAESDAGLMLAARRAQEELAAHQQQLEAEERRLDRILAERREQESRIAALAVQREDELNSLREQRAQLEASLAELKRAWEDQAVPVLEGLAAAFRSLPDHWMELQPDSIRYHAFPPGATVVFSEEALNRFLRTVPPIEGLEMNLQPGLAHAAGRFAGLRLEVEGRFVPVSPASLRYEPDQVLLEGIPLPPELVAGVLQGGGMELDLTDVIRPGKIHELRVEDDRLVMEVGL